MPSMARAQQKRGGSFRIAKGHGQTSDTLNPAIWENGFMSALAHGVHGYIASIRADGSVKPELAESWEASSGADSWSFKIRTSATYHDGRSVTPEDVVASINYHRGAESTSAAKPIVESITDIRIDGDRVVMDLSSGNADFPVTLTDYHLTIHPSSDGTIDWRSGIGAGPYKLVEFNPGVSARFARNENDWDDTRGFFDEVEMLSVIDLNARTTSLVSGDVNAIDKLDLKTAGLMGRNPNVKILTVDGNQHYTFAMSTNKAPFTDVNVRRALKYGVNRQEMVDKILFGYGSVGNDHPIGRGQRYFNSEMAQTEYDPDKAKFYLKEAGLDSVDVELAVADAAFPGAVDAGILFQNSAKEAGINVNVARVPNDGYWSDVWMQHPFSAVYWSGRVVEDAMFTTTYSSGASWNDTFWSNERFDQLLVTARAELDEDKRREMYYEMQVILNEDGGAIIPMFASFVFATDQTIVTGEQMGSQWDVDGERWMERWSFA